MLERDGLLDDLDATRARLTDLGRRLSKGITAYGGQDAADPAAAVDETLGRLPALRRALKQDVTAACRDDPAVKSYCEVIRSYPGFQAILTHRVVHVLYEADYVEYARDRFAYAEMPAIVLAIGFVGFWLDRSVRRLRAR